MQSQKKHPQRTAHYRSFHVHTEGDVFIFGGGGVYVNTLTREQAHAEDALDQKNIDTGLAPLERRIALLIPAYKAINQENFTSAGYHIAFVFKTLIYDRSGHKLMSTIKVWKKIAGRLDCFAIEPDENHIDYFTLNVDQNGVIEGLRSIHPDYKKEMNTIIEEIKCQEASIQQLNSIQKEDTLQADTTHIKNKLIKNLQRLQTRKREILAGKHTQDITQVTRLAHFAEIGGAFINYLNALGSVIDVVHSHNFGEVNFFIAHKNIAKVNTFHSDAGQGIFVNHLMREDGPKFGKTATLRTEGINQSEVTYAVSTPFEALLTNTEYEGAHYSIPLANRGRITSINNIPDVRQHHMDRVWDDIHADEIVIQRDLSFEHFKQLAIHEKKALAKEVLAQRLNVINPAWKFDSCKKTVLFLGRINRDKGAELLVDVISLATLHDCNVLIVGLEDALVPDYSKNLISTLRQNFPSIPFLIGEAIQASLGCLHRAAADIGVGPSIWQEAFGLAYAEGTLYGIHYLVTDSGGSRFAIPNYKDKSEIIQYHCGATFPLLTGNDENHLATQRKIGFFKQQISKLRFEMDHIQDADERDALCQRLNACKIELDLALAQKNAYTALHKCQPVNVAATAVAMKEAFSISIELINHIPHISDQIVETALNAFSMTEWLGKIDEVYHTAIAMNQSKKRLRELSFFIPTTAPRTNSMYNNLRSAWIAYFGIFTSIVLLNNKPNHKLTPSSFTSNMMSHWPIPFIILFGLILSHISSNLAHCLVQEKEEKTIHHISF